MAFDFKKEYKEFYMLELSSQVQQPREIEEDLKRSPETKTFARTVVEFMENSLYFILRNFGEIAGFRKIFS